MPKWKSTKNAQEKGYGKNSLMVHIITNKKRGEERKGKHRPFFFIIDIFKKLKLYLNIIEQGFLF